MKKTWLQNLFTPRGIVTWFIAYQIYAYFDIAQWGQQLVTRAPISGYFLELATAALDDILFGFVLHLTAGFVSAIIVTSILFVEQYERVSSAATPRFPEPRVPWFTTDC